MRNCLILATTLSLMAATSFAAPLREPLKPVQDQAVPIPVDVFKNALRFHVAEVPELKPVWRYLENNFPDTDVYLSGGLLRGLIHYLYHEVQANGTVRGIQALRTPSLSELLLQEWSDSDIVAPAELQDHVRSIFQRNTHTAFWDVLTYQFMQDSIGAGGATLDKVMVSPRRIWDDYNSIESYLRGELVFHKAESPSVGQVHSNTWVALALRLLRLQNNLPEVRVNDHSRLYILDAIDQEWYQIQRNQNVDYWIRKSLLKYMHSCRGDIAKFLQGLYDYGLLRILAHHGYSLPKQGMLPGQPPLTAISDAQWQDFVSEHRSWPTERLLDAAIIMGINEDRRRDFSEYVIDFLGANEADDRALKNYVRDLGGCEDLLRHAQ